MLLFPTRQRECWVKYCLLQRNLLSAVMPVRLVEYGNLYLNSICLGCIHRHIPYKHLASVYTHLYVVFVYLKLKCLEFLSALSASVVCLNFERCHEAPDGPGGGASLFILLSNAQGSRCW